MAEQIEAFISGLNRAWQAGDLVDVARRYHPQALLLPPDVGPAIIGRDAIVASYEEFNQAASLVEFTLTELISYPFDHGGSRTHMVHMQFDMTYKLDESVYEESGLEVYTIVESDGELQIVWRSQNVLDSRSR